MSIFTPLQKSVIDYIIAENEDLRLHVAEERAGYAADRRTEFNKRCETLKKPLVETARFIEELEQQKYIRTLRKPIQIEELPKDYGEHWRRYENFYMSELEPLIFACTSLFIPRLKLYKYWEQINRKESMRIRPLAVGSGYGKRPV
jgi:hypothetical protein